MPAVRARLTQLRNLMKEVAPPYAQRTHVVGTGLSPAHAFGCVLLIGLSHSRKFRSANIVSKRHQVFPLLSKETVMKYLQTEDPTEKDVRSFLPLSYKDAFFVDL